MAGFDNDVVYSTNVDFRGTTPIAGQVTTDGQLLIGSTAAPYIKVAIPTGSNGIAVTTGGGTLDFSQSGTFTQQQVYYVGKHGNDANAGTNINTAVLTFGQALTLAAAATPGAANRFSIVCLDDGIYTENITCISYVNIDAPNASIVGTITLVDDSSVKFREQTVSTGTVGLTKLAGTSYAFAEIDKITLAGTAIGLICTAGFVNFTWKTLYVENGFGIGDLTASLEHVHLKGGDIYISGTGGAIARANAGTTVGRVDHILDTGGGNGTAIQITAGTFDLQISRIQDCAVGLNIDGGVANIQVCDLDCTAAYDIAAGAELNLFVNEMAGTETVAATGIRHLMRLDGSSYIPGDLTISRDTGGAGTVKATIANEDNTAAASNSSLSVSVGGTTSTGDPYVNFLVTGSTTYSLGIDNDDSDVLCITTGAAPSAGTEYWRMTSAGERTMPLQPAFLAYNSATDDNVTGNGSSYTIIYDTEVFDQNADYNNATGVFTAPVTGRYRLTTQITFSDATATGGRIEIVTSNRTYYGGNLSLNAIKTAGNSATLIISTLCDMDASDTVYVAVLYTGAGADTVDVYGVGNPQTLFCGELIC